MTLTDFLLARIAEDEEGATPSEHWGDLSNWEHDVPVQFWDYGEVHIGHRRFLRECETKRALVHHLTRLAQAGPIDRYNPGDEALACTLRHLASVYVDHPDYRQEWKP